MLTRLGVLEVKWQAQTKMSHKEKLNKHTV
jgi:hypothetical protein